VRNARFVFEGPSFVSQSACNRCAQTPGARLGQGHFIEKPAPGRLFPRFDQTGVPE
jgi:hypothetical protein